MTSENFIPCKIGKYGNIRGLEELTLFLTFFFLYFFHMKLKLSILGNLRQYISYFCSFTQKFPRFTYMSPTNNFQNTALTPRFLSLKVVSLIRQ